MCFRLPAFDEPVAFFRLLCNLILLLSGILGTSHERTEAWPCELYLSLLLPTQGSFSSRGFFQPGLQFRDSPAQCVEFRLGFSWRWGWRRRAQELLHHVHRRKNRRLD